MSETNSIAVGPFPAGVHPSVKDALYLLADALSSGKYNAYFDGIHINNIGKLPDGSYGNVGDVLTTNTEKAPIWYPTWKFLKGVKYVAKLGAEFSSITAALASITDNTSDNQYVIMVAPGSYTENLTFKAYVHIVGNGPMGSVIIESSTQNAHTFVSHIFLVNITFNCATTPTSYTSTFYATASNSAWDVHGDAVYQNILDNLSHLGSGWVNNGLLKYDVTAIPSSSSITSAAFYIKVKASVGGAGRINLRTCDADWNPSTVTFNNQPANTAYYQSGTLLWGNYIDQYIDGADITTAVQSWVTTPATNY